MQQNRPPTNEDLAYMRETISHLKNDFLQLRKRLNQQQLQDFPFIKSREVRKMLRISVSTLQMMRNKGQIPFKRVGGQLLYEYNDVKKLLLNGKTEKR
jgi:5-bromo-4-chloroindolyl phosphate hydrolysis protein